MTPAFWLCLLLVIASGLSAYIGNEWGRKIGKRKLSVFRMRPKHSSTFLTVLLSMCLSLGMMGLLLVSAPALQQALFVPNTPVETLDDYQEALALANTQIQRLNQQQRDGITPETEGKPTEVTGLSETASENLSSVTPQAQTSSGAVPPRLATQPRALQSTLPWQAPASRVGADEVKPAAKTRAPSLAPAAQSAQPDASVSDRPPVETRERPSRLASRRPAPAQMAQNTAAVSAPSRAAGLNEGASPEPAPASTPASAVAALPAYPTGPLFALTLNGDLTPQESQQLHAGIQRLTQNYLQLLGIQSEALQWAPAQLTQEMTKLSATGQYRLEVNLRPQQETRKVPVYVAVQAISGVDDESFDPQTLLENQRLTPARQRQSLQSDLQAVLQQHARQQLALQSPGRAQRLPQRTVTLPFEIFNLENNNGTITGELFLR